MVRWNVECVVVLSKWMSMMAGLSSPKLGLVTYQIVLCSRRNRILPELETDRSQWTEFGAGFGDQFPNVTHGPHRMIPKLETDRSRPILTSWESHWTEFGAGFGDQFPNVILDRLSIWLYINMNIMNGPIRMHKYLLTMINE